MSFLKKEKTKRVINSMGLVLFYLLVMSVLSTILTMMMVRTKEDLANIASNIKLIALSVILVSPLSTFIVYKVYKKTKDDKEEKVLIFNNKISKKNILQVLGCVLLPFVVSIIASQALKGQKVENETTNLILSMSMWLKILSAVIVAPIAEEIMFRGILFDVFNKDQSTKLYPIVSGILFGIMHVQLGSLAEILVPIVITGAAGLFWAMLYQKEKNLYLTIAAHMLYNGIVIILGSI